MKELMNSIKEGRLAVTDSITPLHAEYEAPDVNKGEILRYAGIPASVVRARNTSGFDDAYLKTLSEKCAKCGKGCNMSAAFEEAERTGIPNHCTEITDESASEEEKALDKMLDDAIEMASDKLTYRVSYCCVKIEFDEDGYPIIPFEQHSDDLKKNLKGCSAAIIFAATIGSGIDMLIRRFERTSPAKGLIFQGMGAERVEALCDKFNDDVVKAAKEAGLTVHPRYSPGYGDLPIDVQPHVLGLVDAQRRLGITLNGSCLMSPSKSVTAIIGIER